MSLKETTSRREALKTGAAAVVVAATTVGLLPKKAKAAKSKEP